MLKGRYSVLKGERFSVVGDEESVEGERFSVVGGEIQC